ncbi:hypothetical protein THAOC_35808 [Thalassiosira oceanica]|uniref:Uncharacterized protein n=1 Tax=Thalassiosira oceanica TaxID=159749 RepID=K0RG60_THAOC|nr:hypothetical protein THAOC_35808 [Thalassiosira oceanica]|eukprot:EJK45572.1 hypothetical protein THAOC_35808 [Thalassiosira oceanica]
MFGHVATTVGFGKRHVGPVVELVGKPLSGQQLEKSYSSVKSLPKQRQRKKLFFRRSRRSMTGAGRGLPQQQTVIFRVYDLPLSLLAPAQSMHLLDAPAAPDLDNVDREKRAKRVESREWSGSPYARLSPTSPLGVGHSAHLQRDYSTLSASVSSAGTDDRESRPPPWPPLKPVATEVRYGIELSLCSAACPSGTTTPPSGPISVLGSSAAPRRHLCRLASRPSSDLQIRQRRCRGELVYKSTFDVANRRLTEARGCGETRLALGTPWFSSFSLVFRMNFSFSRGVDGFA